jgi:hypothetical protein
MRAIWVIAVTFSSMCLVSSALAQEDLENLFGDKPATKTLDPTEERTDLTPAQLRDLAATLRINAALDKNTSLDAVDQPLYEVVRGIAREHKIPIVLDPEGLETSDVTPDQLITIKLDEISLRNALRTLLKPLHLSFIVRNEVLTITALDCPDRLATVRTFPLGRLVERMDDPSELISTLEIIWPDEGDRIGDTKNCQPRARILANHLVVRGSPRHLELAEQLIDGLMAERPEPEVKATIKLPAALRPKPVNEPMPVRTPKERKAPKPPQPPEAEAAQR